MKKNFIDVLEKTKKHYYINCILSIMSGISIPFSIVATAYFFDSINQSTNLIIASIILIMSYVMPIVNIPINYYNKIIYNMTDIKWNSYVSTLISKIPYYEYENQEIFNKIKQISDNNLYQKKVSFTLFMIKTIVNILLLTCIFIRVSIILLICEAIVLPLVNYVVSKITKKRYNAMYDTNLDRRKALYKSSLLRDYTFAKELRINDSSLYMLNDWQNEQKNLDKKELNIKFKYGLFGKIISNVEYIIILFNLIILLLLFLNNHITLGVFTGLSINIFNINFYLNILKSFNLKKVYHY